MAIALPCIGMVGTAVTGWEPWTLDRVATTVALIAPVSMAVCFGPRWLRNMMNGL